MFHEHILIPVGICPYGSGCEAIWGVDAALDENILVHSSFDWIRLGLLELPVLRSVRATVHDAKAGFLQHNLSSFSNNIF